MVEECSCDKQLLLNNQVFSQQSGPQSEKMGHNDMVEQKNLLSKHAELATVCFTGSVKE